MINEASMSDTYLPGDTRQRIQDLIKEIKCHRVLPPYKLLSFSTPLINHLKILHCLLNRADLFLRTSRLPAVL